MSLPTILLLLSLFFITASSSGISSLLTFYTGFRKLCLCRCGVSQAQANFNNNGDMISGEIYSHREMPWLATIDTGNTTIRGTLISDRHVITAASPLFGHSPSQLSVTLGLQQHCKEGRHTMNSSVEAIVFHPAYSQIYKNNDIALIRLRHAVQYSQFISPICMPIYDIGDEEQLAWTTSVQRRSSKACLSRISSLPMLPSQSCIGSAVQTSMISEDKGCLGPLGVKSIVCEDDIGSPVMYRWTSGSPYRIVGVITDASCDDEAAPLFTRIINTMPWIRENIRNDCQCF